MKRKTPEPDPFDWMAPFKAPGRRGKLNAGVMDTSAVQDMIAESDNPVLALDTFWKFTNVGDLIREGDKRRTERKLGGKSRGEDKTGEATVRYQQWADEKKKLIAEGKDERAVAAILAKRYSVSPSTIRRGLNKARAS